MTRKNKGLGDGEKTVIVGVLVLGFWLGIDALAKRAEKASKPEEPQKTMVRRRLRVARFRRRREAA